jgi:hypothetical protein
MDWLTMADVWSFMRTFSRWEAFGTHHYHQFVLLVTGQARTPKTVCENAPTLHHRAHRLFLVQISQSVGKARDCPIRC